MSLSRRVSIPPHVLARELGDEVVILDLKSGTYFGLDPVGARIWHLLAENKALDEVCAVLVDDYDVTRDKIEEDILRLTDELAAKKLIQFA